MIRIASLNVNGIRSALQKGLADVVQQQNLDILCVQELKCQAADIGILNPQQLVTHVLPNYHFMGEYASKKGYSGVGIFSRQPPKKVHRLNILHTKFNEQDAQTWQAHGRYIAFEFNDVTVVSVYLPSGSSSDVAQAFKWESLLALKDYFIQLSNTPVLILGDLNIAHQNIDLKNWRGNQKNSGFLPEERAWLSEILQHYTDVYRALYPEVPGYTWWSNRGQAFAKDVGWRIDYHVMSPHCPFKPQHAHILKDARLSDHAMLTIDYI